ncbi:MAG: tetratricopeptide repeat protein [Prevotellaceae bacterium]|jgi:tetratricopeptide (TPR) repeat protein|nr:tetratricopeptide repeat protein [Prevotellaceae bacterium]
MKKIACIVCLFCTLQVAAQTEKEIEKYRTRIAKSDTEIADPKKGADPKTWVNRALLFKEIYDAPRKNLVLGIAQLQVKLLFKDEKFRTDNVEIDGTAYEILRSADKKLYFDESGVLAFWVIEDKVVDDPLLKSYAAFVKAYELDEKKSQAKKIKEGMMTLSYNLLQEGAAAFTLHQYGASAQCFETSVLISGHPIINTIDSATIYNTALAARFAENNEKALAYFGKAIAINYDANGNAYANYATLLREQGDTLKSMEVLNQGFVKYPKNQDILIQLINAYMSAGSDLSAALPFIHEAQQNEPDNASLFNAEGIIYEQLNDTEKAFESYMKALEIDPDFFASHYSIGALYYNEAVELQNKAGSELDDAKYRQLDEAMKAAFKRALPYLTRAHELMPEERSIVETLRSICFRFREESPEMTERFNHYSKVLEEL